MGACAARLAVVSPARRTWTLTGLDRSRSWRLYFDHEAFRWEVEDLDEQHADAGGDGPAAGRSQAGADPHGVAPQVPHSPAR